MIAPGMTNGTSTVLFVIFVLEKDSNTENPIVIHKYKNSWYGSNHNGDDFNTEHLPFGMVYHYYQRSPCTIRNNGFWLTALNIVIGTSTVLFLILWEVQRKKHNTKKEYVICINTDEIDQTVIVKIEIYSNHNFYSDCEYAMIAPYC